MKLLIINARLDERNCIYFEHMMGAKALVRSYMCIYITKFKQTDLSRYFKKKICEQKRSIDIPI